MIADVNTNTNGWPIYLNVSKSGTDIRLSNGATVTVDGNDVAWRFHTIAENILIFTMAANPNKSLTTSALRFTATAAGKTSTTLTGITFNNLIAGYVTGGIQIVVYKDLIAAGNIAGTGVVGTVTGLIPLTANNVIDAGSTVNYIVAIEGAVVNPASYTTDWSVSLTNANFGWLFASTYYNVAAFPFTSVK